MISEYLAEHALGRSDLVLDGDVLGLLLLLVDSQSALGSTVRRPPFGDPALSVPSVGHFSLRLCG